jgi:hypothetical protein
MDLDDGSSPWGGTHCALLFLFVSQLMPPLDIPSRSGPSSNVPKVEKEENVEPGKTPPMPTTYDVQH